MLDFVLFGLSAFMAQILTNLDNLAALLALTLVSGAKRSVVGFLLAQVIVISAALLLALGVEDVVPHWAGYLGLIPLSLGILALIRQKRGSDTETRPNLDTGASVIMVTLLFISLSMDTFAVLAPLLADSAPAFRTAGVIGAVLAALGLATVALLGAKAPFMSGTLAQRLERLVPYVMICAGLYILSNSWTDAI
ncbi:cadmium resistance transporter family protein [Ruegeria denitrificans]|uniref:Cadmium resistance transporter family protein n=1 Tax=Ruegeria denitrificans TaxID=1715692 RepID=A0A0P1IQE0_9RHOB|nr:cadmium resistance transporter [Ruegeria denitrificans]CUJ96009.1 cadmium resistance transporter family protein [Ruegeria denitrificans]